MKGPIFVLDDTQYVSVYENENWACLGVKAHEVRDGCVIAVFDAEGRRLRFDIVRPPDPVLRRPVMGWKSDEGEVDLVAAEGSPTGATELRQLLAERLGDMNPGATLEELVARASLEKRI